MSDQFNGQIALVTGASSGIGRATALAFAREGAKVVVSDIVPGLGEATVALIREAGGEARYINADVTQVEQVQALVAGTVAAYGKLDIAFNNAGVEGVLAPLGELAEADWSKVLAVNLTGVFSCMKYELLQMAKQGFGAIVNNASIVGTVAFPGAAAYVAAKHGVLGLTRTAALDYASKGIRVNAVCPGFIKTPMLERAGLLSNRQIMRQLVARHPLNRLGSSEEVADAVLFLASSKASFMTGHPLLVDGGYVAQ